MDDRAMLSQDIVDYLNQAGHRNTGEWLREFPDLHNFVTCPTFYIRPSLLPNAKRICCNELEAGRYIKIDYRDGSQCLIHKFEPANVTVETLENFYSLIHQLEGSCHVERSYLIVVLPRTYNLQESDQNELVFEFLDYSQMNKTA